MYLGIDESNHGKFPEIFVGCFSFDTRSIIEKRLRKNHSRSIKRRNLRGFPYKHIIFTKDFKDIIDPKNYDLVAIGELTKFYNNSMGLEKVFMDGEIKNKKEEKIIEMLYHINKKIKFISKPKMDEKINLVNEADNLANLFYRYYAVNNGKNKTKYLGSLLQPNYKDYEMYFD